jgi:CBS domain containing-hemolysin-like protein
VEALLALEPGSHWAWSVLGLLSIPLLIALNGLFVATEFSLVSVRKTRIEELVRRGVKGARAAEAALAHLDRSIAATQLGITLASIALGWTGEPACADVVGFVFGYIPGGLHPSAIHTLAAVLAFVLITFMHVTFGELVPKGLALEAPDRTSLWLAKPLRVFARLTRPLLLMMSGTANAVLRLLGARPPGGEEVAHSLEELELLIEDTEEAGLLAPEQADYVQNVFHLSAKRVRDCMVPRDKMAALELHLPPDKIMEAVRLGAHTRMPVYDGDVDNIVGIVNTKDLFFLFSLHGVVILHDALYQPLFLKPEQSLGEALQLFRRAHRPMAVVRGDDNKVLGLITLEDILEEIIGDIEDEHDRPLPQQLLLWRRRLLPKIAASTGTAKAGASSPKLGAAAPNGTSPPTPRGGERTTVTPPGAPRS